MTTILPGQPPPAAAEPSAGLEPTPAVVPPQPTPAPTLAPTFAQPTPPIAGRAHALVAIVAVLAVLLAAVATVGVFVTRGSVADLRTTVAVQQKALNKVSNQLTKAQTDLQALRTGLGQTRAGSIDTGAVAPKVLKSVFTVETPFTLGTAFAVQRSSVGGTILVTNYHVVSSQWSSGGRTVKLKQGSRTLSGKITTVRPSDDLASIEVVAELPLLPLTKVLPAVGAPVLVVGSPLGLGGTVTTGVVSALRKGAVQISAPISAGNSGGPVVDRTGRVLAVASAKIVSNNAEGLGFAIPMSTVCAVLLRC